MIKLKNKRENHDKDLKKNDLKPLGPDPTAKKRFGPHPISPFSFYSTYEPNDIYQTTNKYFEEEYKKAKKK